MSRVLLFLALVSGALAQDFQPVPVASLEVEAHQLYRMELAVEGTGLGAQYTRAGQFLQLSVGERRPRFFAIASAPGEGTRFELLLKIEDENDPVLALGRGDLVQVTAPGGAGFPVEAHATKRWILMAMGSGISAVRPLVHQTLARDPAASLTLLYGVRNLTSLPYRNHLLDWQARGVDVRLVLSRPDTADEWTGRTGHVQNHLTAELVEPAGGRTVAVFAVGSNEMMGSIREKLAELGHSEIPIVTNF